MTRLLRFLVLALAAASPALAQRTEAGSASRDSAAATAVPPPATAPAPGSELTVSLVTMGPGDEVWERFGHNALRIRDAARGTDIAYNWGMFSFQDPGFLVRFLTGDTRYWMEGHDFDQTLRVYQMLNRSVWVQELALTPEERLAVRDFVEWNSRDENKFYRYDYFLDNCSTRVRDVIDRFTGGRLRAVTEREMTGTSFRWHTRRLLGTDPPTYTGIQIALGEPADRPISAWEEAFLPMKLRDHVREVRVADGAGNLVPLVKSEQTLFVADRAPEPSSPPSYLPAYLVLGGVIGALVLWFATRAVAGARWARGALATVGALWFGLVGLLGVVLVLAWTATRHIFWYQNENLLQLNPIALVTAIVIPIAFARAARRVDEGVPSRLTSAAVGLATMTALLGVGGLVLKALPSFDQVNAEVIALVLPVHVAFALAVRRVLAPRARVVASAAHVRAA